MAKEPKAVQQIVSTTETSPVDLSLKITELEAALKEQTDKHSFQQRRADEAEKRLKALEAQNKGVGPDRVVLGGRVFDITGTYRADNTFSEVKRGYCTEGVTLIAIDHPH